MTRTKAEAARQKTPPSIAIVLKGYPRLSETFIAREILALEKRGLNLALYSLRFPTDRLQHPIHQEIHAPVHYLPEYLHQEPLRVLRAWIRARRLPGYRTARKLWLRDLAREATRNRVRRFGQACVLATELPPEITRIHAHFLHTPASVARYAALMSGLPWSCSAHAKDIWTTPDWEKREKLAECDWLVTCTAKGRDHLSELSDEADKVALAYHGLDVEDLPPMPQTRRPRDGSDPEDPVLILSVGRAVAKKGYDDVLRALAALPDSLHWRFLHIGGGQLGEDLKKLAAAHGLAERIEWLGSQAHGEVFEAYRKADLFVLASRVAPDGDRDGLPNVLMEAQSQGLACLSTRVSAIPELILDGETGLLVEPNDPAALALALERLIRLPATRARLGAAGAARLRGSFATGQGIDLLMARLDPESATLRRAS